MKIRIIPAKTSLLSVITAGLFIITSTATLADPKFNMAEMMSEIRSSGVVFVVPDQMREASCIQEIQLSEPAEASYSFSGVIQVKAGACKSNTDGDFAHQLQTYANVNGRDSFNIAITAKPDGSRKNSYQIQAVDSELQQPVQVVFKSPENGSTVALKVSFDAFDPITLQPQWYDEYKKIRNQVPTTSLALKELTSEDMVTKQSSNPGMLQSEAPSQDMKILRANLRKAEDDRDELKKRLTDLESANYNLTTRNGELKKEVFRCEQDRSIYYIRMVEGEGEASVYRTYLKILNRVPDRQVVNEALELVHMMEGGRNIDYDSLLEKLNKFLEYY